MVHDAIMGMRGLAGRAYILAQVPETPSSERTGEAMSLSASLSNQREGIVRWFNAARELIRDEQRAS
jgi:hypothetical protein